MGDVGPLTIRIESQRTRVQALLWALALLGWLGLAVGCATRSVDWAGRVGTYTYDDAVRELGPPEKSAKLSDGSMVADWVTVRGMRAATVYGAGWYPYGRHNWGLVPGPMVVSEGGPDRLLRLSFDPQGKLASWKKIYQ